MRRLCRVAGRRRAVSARALPPGDLHLWRLSLELPAAAQAAAEAMLAPEEQQRAARFHFAADALAFTAARGQLRQVLGAYQDCAPAALTFAANEYGKPHLSAPLVPLHFNLAHSGTWALVSLSAAEPVGVDVEAIRPRRGAAPGRPARTRAGGGFFPLLDSQRSLHQGARPGSHPAAGRVRGHARPRSAALVVGAGRRHRASRLADGGADHAGRLRRGHRRARNCCDCRGLRSLAGYGRHVAPAGASARG